jgi:Tfp pilus assembly protein PilF
MRYERFQLQIAMGPAGRFAVHARSPRGEGRAQFDDPFPGEAFWLPGQDAAEGAARLEAVGERLFEALFQGEILGLYERSVDLLAADPAAGLRLELTFDPRDPDLAPLQALPWELLRQPSTPEFIALDRRRPVVRYLAVPRSVYAIAQPKTVRILAVGANPEDPRLRRLNLSRELANLREAIGTAAGLEVFTPAAPTLAALRQALLDRECHVLHFMGHGGATTSGMALFFETAKGRAAPVSGVDLTNALVGFPTLRLVVLNVCDSAAVPGELSGEGQFDAFAGIANSLVLGGMPAVIAMQRPISDQAAIAFSRMFYRQLAAGDPVDAAVAEGRQAVHSARPARLEWATPVLFMRTPTGELFPAQDIPAEQPGRGQLARRLGVALLGLLLACGAALGARSWRVERLVTEGATRFAHGQWPEARERFQAALALAPHSAEVLSDLAGSEEKLGDVRAAEEHYREAVQWQPGSAEHLYNLGHFLNVRERYDEAYPFLLQAATSDPERVDAYGELARAALRLGMLGRARVTLSTALALDPERPALYRLFGELELKVGDPRAAISHLNAARRRYPLGDLERVETTWLLIQTYDRLEDESSTCREISELRRLDPPRVTAWALAAEEVAARRHCRPG